MCGSKKNWTIFNIIEFGYVTLQELAEKQTTTVAPHRTPCSIAWFWLIIARASEEKKQGIVGGNSNINVLLSEKLSN